MRWADLSDDEDNSAELYQPGDVILVIRFEDGTAEIAAMRGEQTISELNEHIERKRGLQRSQFVLKHNEQFLKRGTIESLGVQACVLYVVSRTDANGAARG